ncbi:MAG: hypothetical protein OEV55_07535, partial [candidate division Zixibacteria bacterium]|nr:hypothetical protein [candidate division Zixibacteria bacterium]
MRFNLDRKIIFVLIALAVALPLIFKLGLPNRVTPEVKNVFEKINVLEDSSVVLISFDFEASSFPEVQPLADVILQHSFSRGLRVIGISLLAEGTALGEELLKKNASDYNKTYGKDYVFLGFRPQVTATILGLGEDFQKVFPEDYYGNSISGLELTRGIKNYDEIVLLVSVADGDLPLYWVNFAVAGYEKDLAVLSTAVMATSFYPFLNSGQIKGLVSGLKGAAEYEILLDKPGMGSKGMDAQSMAHLLIVILVILGNIGYWLEK